MNSKQVKESLWNGISEKIIQYNFKFIKKYKRWERDISGGVQIFDLLFELKSDTIYVKPEARVKLFLIEDIYHKVSQKEERYNDATLTIGNGLGQIMSFYQNNVKIGHGEGFSFKIENENDVEILLEVIPIRFKEFILPYFDTFSSISQVDKLLNEEPTQISIHNWLYPLRACIALIAARLNHNPKFSELVEIYKRETNNANSRYRAELENLIELLNSNNYF